MIRRVPAFVVVVILGICGACERTQTNPPHHAAAPTPEPVTALPVEPPKPVPVQLGEPPRLKEEPR